MDTPHESRIMRALRDLGQAAPDGGEVDIDVVGQITQAHGLAHDEIEGVFSALEARGVTVHAPSGGDGESLLLQVVTAARAHRERTGAAPNVAALSHATGLSEEAVRRALGLAKVMGRR
jgi:hypothetical protein